jgi:hypothetical protein
VRSNPSLREAPNYVEQGDAANRIAIAYQGHLANSGGLQGHSLGDDYPFTVVGCMVDRVGDGEATSHATRYYVLNAATGQIYVRDDGCTFATTHAAHDVAAALKGHGDPIALYDTYGFGWIERTPR